MKRTDKPCTTRPHNNFRWVGSARSADVARAYLYCMEQEFGTGIVLTVDGGTTLV